MSAAPTFQEVLLRLSRFWGDQNCALLQPYDIEVGAGTLREALLLLVTDALVVAQGQRGFRVAPISIADFEDITRTRVLLETEALRRSCASGGEEWEAAIVAAFEPEATLRDDMDGVSLEFPDWRFNLRSSNTEPVVRLNVEAAGNADLLADKTATLTKMLQDHA